MKLTSRAARQLTAAAILLPAGLTPAGSAATRPHLPVTAYVVGAGCPGAVTPVRTATGKRLKPIPVGCQPAPIAIAPDGKIAYVATLDIQSVTPVRTATNTPLRPILIAGEPIAITP